MKTAHKIKHLSIFENVLNNDYLNNIKERLLSTLISTGVTYHLVTHTDLLLFFLVFDGSCGVSEFG